MKKGTMLVVSGALVLPTIALAQTTHTKVSPTRVVQKIAPKIDSPKSRFIILKQDLFNRNDPNNLRSDWPAPPAQPGQF
jgi:hypothetical protein